MKEWPTKEKFNIKTSKIEGPQDFNKIIEIQKNDGFEHAYYLTKERLEKLIQRGEEFFMVFLNDEPIAFASIDLDIRARIHFFCVEKNNAGKGIGTELLEKIICEAANKDYKKIHAYVEVNSPIEGFFSKNGFEEVGFHKDRFGAGKDSHILERDIEK